MKYLQFEFNDISEAIAEMLAAELSSIDNFEGINFDDNSMLVCYVFNDEVFNAVSSIAAKYEATFKHYDVEQQNWNAIWESSFEPIIIDEFCHIRAGFHAASDTVFDHEIIITPKMSFGTGHHATTQSVIRLMKNIDFKSKNVFDFGTGTGILAILASKLGAKHVIANDVDDWCTENTIENCLQNKVANVSATLDSIETIAAAQQFDVVLANINRHILLSHVQHMYAMLANNGQLILSGILLDDVAIIDAAALSVGFTKVKELEQNNWVAIHYAKKS